MKTVNRLTLADAVYNVLGLSGEDAIEVTCDLFDVLSEALANHETIHISGFGKFSTYEKPAYAGVLPDGTPSVHARHWTVRWKRSDLLIERLNAEGPAPNAVIKPKPKLRVQPRAATRLTRKLTDG